MKKISLRKAIGIGLLLGILFISQSILGTGFAFAENVKVYAFTSGWLHTKTHFMIKDTRVGEPVKIPIIFFLIRHGNDWVAFDTGNNGMIAKDPAKWWGQRIVKSWVPEMKIEDEFKIQIEKKLGLEIKDIKYVILSHAHMDHAGAVDNFAGKTPFIYRKKNLLNCERSWMQKKQVLHIALETGLNLIS